MVVIVGVGLIGLVVIMIVKFFILGCIIVIDFVDVRLEKVFEFGVDVIINNGNEDLIVCVMDLM